MEINQVDNEVKDLITRKSVYGMETLINAIDRAIQDKEDLINGKD